MSEVLALLRIGAPLGESLSFGDWRVLRVFAEEEQRVAGSSLLNLRRSFHGG